MHHGDCVEGIAALEAASVDLVIADPPYNIAVQGSEWDTVPNYLAWSRKWLEASVAALRPGGSLFIYGSPAKLWICHLKILAAELGLEFKQHISWVYKQGGDSRLKGMTAYSVRMEHLEWFVKPGAPHTFNAEAAAEPYTEAEAAEALAKGVGRVTAEALSRGRPPRNWWEIPRENSRSKERQYGLHPSMKPLKICERLVEVHSRPGELVLIPFGGSGSECVSAAEKGRRVIAFETDGAYFKIILRRMHGHGVLPPHITPPPPLKEEEAAAAAAADAAAAEEEAAALAAAGGWPLQAPAQLGQGCGAAGQGGAMGGSAMGGMLLGAGPSSSPLTALDSGLQRDARYSSGYMGVYKHGKRWAAKVMRNGTLKSIGTFNTPREAAAAYARECAHTPDAERPGAGRPRLQQPAAVPGQVTGQTPSLGQPSPLGVAGMVAGMVADGPSPLGPPPSMQPQSTLQLQHAMPAGGGAADGLRLPSQLDQGGQGALMHSVDGFNRQMDSSYHTLAAAQQMLMQQLQQPMQQLQQPMQQLQQQLQQHCSMPMLMHAFAPQLQAAGQSNSHSAQQLATVLSVGPHPPGVAAGLPAPGSLPPTAMQLQTPALDSARPTDVVAVAPPSHAGMRTLDADDEASACKRQRRLEEEDGSPSGSLTQVEGEGEGAEAEGAAAVAGGEL